MACNSVTISEPHTTGERASLKLYGGELIEFEPGLTIENGVRMKASTCGQSLCVAKYLIDARQLSPLRGHEL